MADKRESCIVKFFNGRIMGAFIGRRFFHLISVLFFISFFALVPLSVSFSSPLDNQAAASTDAEMFRSAEAALLAAPDAEWSAGGTVIAAFKFGPGAGEVGCADDKTALYDFISPASLFYKNGALFILDTPNFRLNKYVVKLPGGSFVYERSIVLYEPPARSGFKSGGRVDLQPVEPAAPLFTDFVVLDNGAMFVASSREKLIYHYDASGVLVSKIKPAVKLEGITRIWADSEKKILIEDPFGGSVFVINSSGALIYELDLSFQPLFLPSGDMIKVEYCESVDESREISIKTYRIPNKFESASVRVKFHLPLQNFMALGSDEKTGYLTAYAVLGACGDAPAEAYFVKIDLLNGDIVDKIPAPVSPEMSCMRYVRAAGVSGEKKESSFIFARSNEDEYSVTRHSFGKR